MNRLLLKKQRWLRAAIILFIVGCTSGKVGAQSNPYNISTQRGQYFNFQDSKAAMQRSMDAMKNNTQDMFLYNRAKDAGDNRNAQLRNEYVFGYAFISADYSLKYRVREDDQYSNNIPMDTSISMSMTPRYAIHFGAGTSYPIATVSKNGALTLSCGLGYNFVKWQLPNVAIQGDTMSIGLKSFAVAVPITLDFKSGAEAMLDRSKRTCFTIGFGVQPTYNLAMISSENAAGYFKLLPAAKVEFGFATSFCTFKLRATGLLGKQQYADFEGVRGYAFTHSYDLSLKGSNQVIVALVIMPFTSQWENNEWYRQR